MAAGEVHAGSEHNRVTIRVRVLDDKQWNRVVTVLRRNLRHIASMMEGQLPEELLTLDNLDMFPRPDEIEADCECVDYRMPCAHMVAAHYVIGDALDGDPFSLLTLRGRTREQLMAALRRSWGDPKPMGTTTSRAADTPTDADWTCSPEPLVRPKFRFRQPETEAVGLRALGPPPGGADLGRALGPLYVAGARAAHALALRDAAPPTTRRPRPHAAAVVTPLTTRRPEPTEMAEFADDPSTESTLTELLVDLLAKRESAKSKEIASALDVPMVDVRSELLQLEKLGIVYRTGQTRGTRWWLG
jgi:hypothetical protein